ncbi:cysteine rich repeat-containing protein [Nitrobacter sp. NHB1]|uniref:cysteine rich repeat-containing protein n=1 Tax=Nitrobacter sp. NHB1 TaxID=3119830 RepID=UPI00300046EE
MSKIFLSFALLLTFGLTTMTAQAQGQSHGGTDAEQRACARDVSRFCRKVIDQGDFTILACLQQHRPKLTKACHQVLLSHGQ